MLGEIEKADEKFKKLVEKYPEWGWGYVGWGDMYDDIGQPKKAEQIYRKAFEVELEDEDDLLDLIKNRIKDLG